MMPTSHSDDPITQGQAALRAADWPRAKACFVEALRMADAPEAHDGLGIALWWLNDISAAHDHRTQAYHGYKARGDAEQAAMIACWLAREQVFLHGNAIAMQGWFARADRLLATLPPGRAARWCAMLRASVTEPNHTLAATTARIMGEARTHGDGDLEAMALAFHGQAKVVLGAVAEGMARLDEAMAMATGGEAHDLMVISEVFCVMLSACDTAGDLDRCAHWCRVAAEFAQRHHCPFLSAYCRTTYGSLMTATGRWQDAETALVEAIRAFEVGHRGLRVSAVIKLADLRVCQGRFDEAKALLAGLEDQGAARVPLARLHLAQGEPELARAVLEQALASAPVATLEQFAAWRLLVEVLLTLGDGEAARRAAAGLMALAQPSGSDVLAAQAELAAGQVSLGAGDMAAALAHFRAGLARLQAYEQSLVAGRIRLEMARTVQHDDRFGAQAWAKAALATFDRIGAARDAAEAAALLRRLGGAPAAGPRLRQPLTAREEEILALLALGLSNRDIAERLIISPKTVEHHVSRILSKLDLHSRAEAAVFALSQKHNAKPT